MASATSLDRIFQGGVLNSSPNPINQASITFPGGVSTNGAQLQREQVQEKPMVHWDAEPGALYT